MNMGKNILTTVLAVMAFSLILSSCKKTNKINQDVADKKLIEQYVANNKIKGQFTASGLYYVIIKAGTSNHPTFNSEVTVSYKGYYLDNTLLDQGDYFTSKLSNLIKGWQEGIPLIGEGGKIKLIIPSSLAYGANPSGGVRSNAVLVFDINLHSFNGN